MTLSLLVLLGCNGPDLQLPETELVPVPPRPVRGLHLAGPDGPLDESAFVGRWTLVSLGWLRCPDVCPTALRGYADLLPMDDVHVWFVDIDPEHDSEHLVDQVRWYDPDILPVTGSRAALDHFATSIGLAYRPDGDGWEHSTSAALVDPQANVVGYVLRPGDAVSTRSAIEALQRQHRPSADLWVRSAPPGAQVLAGFGDIHATIVGLSAPAFERAELHASLEVDGMMRMERLDAVNGGRTLAPGNDHIMLIGPKQPTHDSVLLDLEHAAGTRSLVRAPIR